MFDYVHDPLIGYVSFFFGRAMIPTYLRGYPTYGIQQAAKKEALVTLVPYEISPFTSI
jgi:hypothetical protein